MQKIYLFKYNNTNKNLNKKNNHININNNYIAKNINYKKINNKKPKIKSYNKTAHNKINEKTKNHSIV